MESRVLRSRPWEKSPVSTVSRSLSYCLLSGLQTFSVRSLTLKDKCFSNVTFLP